MAVYVNSSKNIESAPIKGEERDSLATHSLSYLRDKFRIKSDSDPTSSVENSPNSKVLSISQIQEILDRDKPGYVMDLSTPKPNSLKPQVVPDACSPSLEYLKSKFLSTQTETNPAKSSLKRVNVEDQVGNTRQLVVVVSSGKIVASQG
jgi:hypothetical protein